MSARSDDALVAFLRSAAAQPFTLGIWDCGRLVAQWVWLKRGIEPGEEFIGRYSTALGLARLLKRRGGLVAHFEQCLAAVGVMPTETPQRGDVAVVAAPEGPTGVIMVSPTTSACLSQAGFHVRQLPILAAWSVECRRG